MRMATSVANPRLVRPRHYLLLTRHEGISSPALHRRRHIVGEAERPRAFLVRIREDAEMVESGIGDETLELGEIGIGLAGEADDERGPEGDVRDRDLMRVSSLS